MSTATATEKLTKNQIKILKALQGTDFKLKKFKTRAQISKITKINSGFGYSMGTPNTEEDPSQNSLSNQGLIKGQVFEGSREIHYCLTAKGKKVVKSL